MPEVATTEDAKPTEEPKGLIAKLGAGLPIALTAIATAFAGMSTTELQRAMFWKSQAGQDQSKAANQWSLFGFKRSRALEMETSAIRSRADAGYLKFTFAGSATDSPERAEALKWLNGEGPPRVELPKPEDARLVQLIEDIKKRKEEGELNREAMKIPIKTINDAIDAAEKFTADTDDSWSKILPEARKEVRKETDAAIRTKPDEPIDLAKRSRADSAMAHLFLMEERRYRIDGALNNQIGYLYEARVRYSSAESDRHRIKSESFFYAMLAAQVGATIAALGIAKQQRSALWALAGLSGLIAVAIGGYVYITL